ncbi:NRDE family protein [Hydrocarboniphaga sp.]|uniref:NRDE family protein n=1 Tax=Hydrocarboniphaga sp. TaxID=2033016 RepID=UPI003D0B6258
MCLIAFAWQTDPQRPLVLIANRDEFQERPAAPLAFWEDAPEIAAGRDLREHGTWLGLSRRGRMAAVTNVREVSDMQKRARSRGALTTDFLRGTHSAAEHAAALSADAAQYGGYNLLLWDGRELVYASNRPNANWHRVEPGVHGLSNAQLDTPWPKVRWAHRELDAWMHDRAAQPDTLLAAMTSRDVAADAELPDTGVGIEAERLLAPPFIYRPGYGTRCTTWLQIGGDHNARIRERRYDDQARPSGDSELRFRIV